MRQDHRLPFLFLCPLRLLSIVVPADSFNSSIDAVRAKASPDTAPKYKPAVSVNLCLTESNNLLTLPLRQQRFPHLSQHGNDTDSRFRLRGCDVKLAFPVALLTVNQIVIDRDKVFVKVAVFPSQANHFTNAATRSQHQRKEGKPMVIGGGLCYKVYKGGLLVFRQSVAFRLLPIVAPLDFAHYTVCFTPIHFKSDMVSTLLPEKVGAFCLAEKP